jgi:GAF domain-containing protein
MSRLFWLDSIAYGISTVLAAAMMLMALATAPKRALNRLFALFALAEAVWAMSSLLMRMAMWQQAGNPTFLLELATLALTLMGPLLLSFTVRYVGRDTYWANLFTALGLVIVAVVSVPLFRHQIVSNPHWIAGISLPAYDISTLGIATALTAALYFVWSLLLFWQERHRSGESYLAWSVLLLLVGLALGGPSEIRFPATSIATTCSVAILGYGIFNRQLLNPLRELAVTLERRVEDRTQELSEAAARLERANTTLAQRGAQLEIAAHVAREAAAIRDVDQLLDETVNLISDRFGFYHAGIFLLDETGQHAVLRAASSEGGRRMLARGRKLLVNETGFVGSVAGTGKSRIAHNVMSRIEAPPDSVFGKDGVPQELSSYRASDADTASFTIPELPLTRSEMALPLKVHDRIIGVLDVHSTEAAAFSEEDEAVLQILSDQVTLAIQNARLLEEAERRIREVDTLLGRHGQEGWERLATERPHWGYIYDGVDVVPRDADRGTETEEKPHLTIPLQVRGAHIGRLDLDLADQPLTPDAAALAQAVAEQASLALENARLFQAAQRSLRETEALYRASQAIGAATSAEEIGHALIDYAATSGVDAARVLLFEHDAQGNATDMVMREGWAVDNRPAQPHGTRLPLADYPLADLMTPHKPIIIEDILTDERANEAARTLIATISGLRSLILVPIVVGGRWIGMLSAGHDEPFTFPEELVHGYETLTGQAAVALESIRLLEETRQRAERERLISVVTARMRETLDVETVLKTAAQEVRRALGLPEVVIQLATGPVDEAQNEVEQTGV